MKKTVWTVACGGYKEASAKVFTSLEDAQSYMREEYEDMVSEMGDTSQCFITDDYAEPYDESMSLDDIYVFQIEEHEVEMPETPLSSDRNPEGKTYQVLRECRHGTDIVDSFRAKSEKEAVEHIHLLALEALYKASSDARIYDDTSYSGYIVYDEDNDSWYEEDFA